MEIKVNQEYCVGSIDVRDINNKEMRQMYELSLRIKSVLDSHKPESKEKEYVSDTDLKLMYAILSVFTEGYGETQVSTFDNFLKEQDVKSTAATTVDDDDE